MIYSPCKGICRLKDNICIGCFRSREEIKEWPIADAVERTVILRNCKKRELAAKKSK
jgi:predicted Fe-S protein YdhL (DUF1289 family)